MREDGVVESYWLLPPHSNTLMKRWDYIPQETCFWRRRIYDAVGGVDPGFQFALDYDLFVRFMERGRMQRRNRFLGAFRKHAASKTASLVEGKVHPEIERAGNGIGSGCRAAMDWRSWRFRNGWRNEAAVSLRGAWFCRARWQGSATITIASGTGSSAPPDFCA